MVCVASAGFVSVSDLLGVEAKLTEAVKGDAVELVAGLGTVGVEVEVTVPTDELVVAEGFDGFDGFLNFHGWFGLVCDQPAVRPVK